MVAREVHDAIFLSASVPDPRRKHFAETADVVGIAAAVSALVYVTLGRRHLIWGGHPAITPMVWLVAKELDVDYGAWVKLYQSRHFRDEFPEDNENFRNVIYTDNVEQSRERSLLLMRYEMFASHHYAAAVFIGGMEGIIDEFSLFKNLQPSAITLPVASTGGGALDLLKYHPNAEEELTNDLDYISLFHRRLGISVREQRYRHPKDQPMSKEERMQRRPPKEN